MQAMVDLGQLPPQLVRTKELLQLTEFEEQVPLPASASRKLTEN
jgi:hypothetical protein